MGWSNFIDTLSTGVGNIPGGATGGFEPTITPTGTMTPEQQQYYTQLLQMLSGWKPEMTAAPGITGFQQPAYSGQMQSALTSLLSGKPAYDINPQTTEDYWKKTMYDPAMRRYETETRPAWRENISNIHSSQADIMEQKGIEDLMFGLESERGKLMYSDEQARRGALESAAGRMISGGQIGLGMSGQEQSLWQALNQMQQGQWQAGNQMNLAYQSAPMQILLQALGMPAMENIVNQPGTMQGILGAGQWQNYF